MALTVTINDSTGTGKITNSINLFFKHELITVKELIEARVIKEVKDFNERQPEYFQGLVQPTRAEQTLNGYRLRERKKIDAEKQVYIALDAFQKNGYFVLIDDKQADSLEQEVLLTASSTINFVKLTPLVGG
jgi:hypothetical protein